MSSENDWIATPIEGRYQAGMRIARDMRQVRATIAARNAIELANQLANLEPPPAADPEGDPMWTVRGQARTRATYGRPCPGDFTGAPPAAPEHPAPQPPPPPATSPTAQTGPG